MSAQSPDGTGEEKGKRRQPLGLAPLYLPPYRPITPPLAPGAGTRKPFKYAEAEGYGSREKRPHPPQVMLHVEDTESRNKKLSRPPKRDV